MKKVCFNSGWYFSRKIGGSLAGTLAGDSSAVRVTLPHDAMILQPRSACGESGNGYFQTGNYQYTKIFRPDAEMENGNVFLRFDGVYQNAFVYVNGAFAGKHAYGYGEWFLDMTKYIKRGEDNEIRVVVKNAVPSGRWYTGGGIYRSVWLLYGGRLHLSPHGVRVSTRNLDADTADLEVSSLVQFTGIGTHPVLLHTEVYDDKDRKVGENVKHLTVFERSKDWYRQRITVHHPVCWDPDHPVLYRYRVQIVENGDVLDEESGHFGIRMLTLDEQHGLRINGKSVKLQGGCIHHDNGIIGAAEFEDAALRRIRKLKACGYNAVRSAHNPMSRELLDACDREGMLVMDEYTDVWTETKVDFDYGMNAADTWEEDITNMVLKDYNHPSVILYSIGNEISGAGNPIDAQWGKRFADCIRALDDTRFVINCINPTLCVKPQIRQILKEHCAQQENVSGDMEINSLMSNLGEMMRIVVTNPLVTRAIDEAADQVDVVGYNYAASRYELDERNRPWRIVTGSESFPGDLDRNWKLVLRSPRVLGDFAWAAWDYLGEAGIGQISYGNRKLPGLYAGYPYKSASCGDLDLTGHREAVSYWRETIWNPKAGPYIAVRPPKHHAEEVHLSNWRMTDAVRSWNWSGCEGKTATVEVYTDADEAALYLNGRQVGRKKVNAFSSYADENPEIRHNFVSFEVPYEPGTLMAFSYRDGQKIGQDELKTAGEVTSIQAVADRKVLPADGSGIAFVEISLVDENKNLNPSADNQVEIELNGPGVILGYGSADPASEENYYDRCAKAYRGRLLAVVRADEKPGTIRLTLRAEGLSDVSLQIESTEDPDKADSTPAAGI